MKFFIDANVLIDFILERPLFYPPAAMIVSYAVENKIAICVSALSVVTSNYVCVDRCKMPHDVYKKKLDFLKTYVEIVSVDSSDIYNSLDSNWNDFEDGVQYFSAIKANADCIVTRNAKDFGLSDIEVVTSVDACEILKNRDELSNNNN